jgi:hypothetical protein
VGPCCHVFMQKYSLRIVGFLALASCVFVCYDDRTSMQLQVPTMLLDILQQQSQQPQQQLQLELPTRPPDTNTTFTGLHREAGQSSTLAMPALDQHFEFHEQRWQPASAVAGEAATAHESHPSTLDGTRQNPKTVTPAQALVARFPLPPSTVPQSVPTPLISPGACPKVYIYSNLRKPFQDVKLPREPRSLMELAFGPKLPGMPSARLTYHYNFGLMFSRPASMHVGQAMASFTSHEAYSSKWPH